VPARRLVGALGIMRDRLDNCIDTHLGQTATWRTIWIANERRRSHDIHLRTSAGEDFAKLHPKLQQRFGFSSAHNLTCIGRGMMTHIWHGPAVVVPFLYLGTTRRIMFPEQAHDISFTIQNYACCDPLGRETISIIRTFYTAPIRRFDAYMIVFTLGPGAK